MNLSSLFPGLGATPAPVATGGYGFNWIIWIIIILIIVWFGRYSFGACAFGYNYPNNNLFGNFGGYPGYPGTSPFGNSWWWFIIIILVLVLLLGGINRL